METNIDHIVVGAKNLEAGISYIKQELNVDIPFGGIHEKLGTHNHLMSLGNNTFLEVISPSPTVKPNAPRWYGLDDPHVVARIQQEPVLLTWVVNTNSITNLNEDSEFDFGEITSVERGQLNWLFGLPEDGRLLASGFIPYLIEWQKATHPSQGMADVGCTLQSIEIFHSQLSWLQSILKSISADKLVKLTAIDHNELPYLVVNINTPTGLKCLSNKLV